MANKKCLVFETMNNITSSMEIVESENPKEVRLTGVFGVAGVKNNNNRIYDKQNYGMMVESLQRVISTEGCLGELEHPNSMNINLNNVSHKIESIEMNEDGTVTGTIVLIDTDKGRNAKAIVEAGVPLYISSRAAGSIDQNGHVTLTTLKTYDLVGTPGFSQAKFNLAENQELESLNESLCIIYEKDSEEDKTEDDLVKDDEPKKDKSDDTKEEDPKEDKDSKDSDDKSDDTDNNKNKDNEDATMQDLKEAIDKLAEKIEGLSADLHVAKESLEEKDAKINELTEKLENLQIPTINYNAIQEWIENEYSPEFKENIVNDVDYMIESKISDATDVISEGVQNWVIDEFGTELQNYMLEEFAPEIQNWVVESYSPEIQNWTINEFAPMVEGWVTEEYSKELEDYLTEEFAPTIEGWINEELVPTIDTWVNEECIPEYKSEILNEVDGNVKAFLEAKTNEKLTNIDNLLEAIDNRGKADDALQLLKESQVDEKYRGIYVVENMPSEYQPRWAMASEAKQQDIIKRSKMYNFTKPGVLESFWSTVDFTENQINENQNELNVDTYHSSIFRQMSKLRKV